MVAKEVYFQIKKWCIKISFLRGHNIDLLQFAPTESQRNNMYFYLFSVEIYTKFQITSLIFIFEKL